MCFPRGKEGAHQVSNRTDSPIRVLMLSTLLAPDVVEYLDSGKVGARSVARRGDIQCAAREWRARSTAGELRRQGVMVRSTA